jgi:hypothetical protein
MIKQNSNSPSLNASPSAFFESKTESLSNGELDQRMDCEQIEERKNLQDVRSKMEKESALSGELSQREISSSNFGNATESENKGSRTISALLFVANQENDKENGERELERQREAGSENDAYSKKPSLQKCPSDKEDERYSYSSLLVFICLHF